MSEIRSINDFNSCSSASFRPVDQEYASSREKVEEFAKQHFQIIASNVEHLDEAEVICLGERHTEDFHRAMNGALIDMLRRKDDIVLVESQSDGQYLEDQIKYVKSSPEVGCWDQWTEVSHRGTAQWQLHRQLKEIRNTLSSPFSIFGRWNLLGSFIGMFIKIFENRFAHNSAQAFIDGTPARNRYMCQQIDESFDQGKKRVFITAGNLHLAPVEKINTLQQAKGPLNFRQADVAYQETVASLQKRKFVILIPQGA